jgi:pectate lyase
MPPVTISGIVKTDSGAALAGATISATNGGGTVTTDVGGNYRLTMPYGWSGTVRPSKAGYLFSPPFKSYASVTSDQAQDYTALIIPTVIISGTVKTDSGAALAGATVSATNGGGTVTTDVGGNYSYRCLMAGAALLFLAKQSMYSLLKARVMPV